MNIGATTRAQTILHKAVSDGFLPGVVAGAAKASGILYADAFGMLDSTRQLGVESIFRIYSMTKAITSVAAMQMVEEGLIGLEEPVEQYLPEIGNLKILAGINRQAQTLILEQPTGEITLRHLLTHTSGFGSELFDPLLGEGVRLGLIPSVFDESRDFLMAPLRFEPGTSWMYGIGTDWLGLLIEKIRAKNLDQVFRERIFAPLDMQDTHFDLPDEKIDRLMLPRHRQADGTFALREARVQKPVFLSGSGGLFSTVPDYLRFIRALLREGELDGKRILRRETVRSMGVNHLSDMGTEVAESFNAFIAGSKHANFVRADGFGLGFQLHTKVSSGGRAAGSMSWAGILNTYFWIDPCSDICGVLMTQISPPVDPKVLRTLAAFERSIYADSS